MNEKSPIACQNASQFSRL